MTRHCRAALFFYVASVLPLLGHLTSLGNTAPERSDTLILRREPSQEESEERETEIDKSGRFVTPSRKQKRAQQELLELTEEPTPNTAPASKQAVAKPTAKPPTSSQPAPPKPLVKGSGFSMVGLSVCIILLAGVFSLHHKTTNKQKNPTTEADSSEVAIGSGSASVSAEPPPPSNGAEGEDEDQAHSNAAKMSGPLELTNEVALMALQFFAVILVTIVCTRLLVCDGFKLQCDQGYNLKLFFRQDFHKVMLDMTFLFLIGRLAASSVMPVNSITFVAVVFLSAMVPSWFNDLSFMHHSISMYQMACSWTAMTWIVSSIIFGFILVAGALHLRDFCFNSGMWERFRAVGELVVILCIFVLPRCFEPGFHMHHWFSMFILAMGCRLPTVWSRGLQAFLIGGYINGIAVYGRDPVLACEAAYDMAYSEQCKFLMMCTWNTTQGPVPPTYIAPDWRSCSAGDYAF